MTSRAFFTVIFASSLLSTLAQSEIEKTRTSTLENLRGFRRQVFKSNLSDQGDSLALMLSNLGEMVKRTRDFDELKEVANYVSISSEVFASSSSADKPRIAQLINNDLLLKVREDDRFAVEGNRGFGSRVNVKLTAQINGAPLTGSYRIFWGYFLGRNVSKLIESNLSQGSSDDYNNPFDLQIRIPGYICFWLKDEQNNKYYITSFDYKILDRQSLNLTINFQPLNR